MRTPPILFDAVLVALFASLPYFGAIKGGFVIDDGRAIETNPDVVGAAGDPTLSWAAVQAIFANDFWGTPLTSAASHKSFRPFTVLTFRVTNLFFGGPHYKAVLHGSNILLNVFCCVLFWYFLRYAKIRVLNCRKAQCFAAALFAVHPVHVENVASLVGRADTLCMIFMICNVLFYFEALHRGWRVHYVAGFLLSYVLSCLSKELGITALAVCAGLDFVVNIKANPRNVVLWVRLCLLGVLSLCALLASSAIRGGVISPNMSFEDNPIHFETDPYRKALHYLLVHTRYARLLVFPNVSCTDWGYNVIPMGETAVLEVLVLYGPLVGLCGAFFVVKGKVVTKAVLCLVWVVVPFLPASGVVPVGTVLAERLLFVPSAGFCMLVGVLLEEFLRWLAASPDPSSIPPAATSKNVSEKTLRNRKAKTVVSVVESTSAPTPKTSLFGMWVCVHLFAGLIALSTITYNRSEDWTDELRLASRSAAHCPQSAKVQLTLGVIAMQRNDPQGALPRFKAALSIYPGYVEAKVSLGRVTMGSGDLKLAKKYLTEAVSADPNHPDGLQYLGVVSAQLGENSNAVKLLEQAVKVHTSKRLPPDAGLWGNYATALAMHTEVAKKREALEAFKTALKIGGSIQDQCGHYRNYIAHQLTLVEVDDLPRSLAYAKKHCSLPPSDIKYYEKSYQEILRKQKK